MNVIIVPCGPAALKIEIKITKPQAGHKMWFDKYFGHALLSPGRCKPTNGFAGFLAIKWHLSPQGLQPGQVPTQ